MSAVLSSPHPASPHLVAPGSDGVGGALRELFADVSHRCEDVRDRFPQTNEAAAASRDNLLSYLALREHDLQDLQSALADQGLSSLGRLEGHVLTAISRVLDHLGGSPTSLKVNTPTPEQARQWLKERSRRLLGRGREGRATRIMVTMDASYAGNGELMQALLRHGMDIARINCAHDGPDVWNQLIETIRGAEKELERAGHGLGRRCRIEMDLAGPKIRTGSLATESVPLKLAIPKDSAGRTLGPREGWLDLDAANCASIDVSGDTGSFVLGLAGSEDFSSLCAGDSLNLVDLRGRAAAIRVVEVSTCRRVRVALDRTLYVSGGLEIRVSRLNSTWVFCPVQERPVRVNLIAGDRLRIYRDPSRSGHFANEAGPAGIACTSREALEKIELGHRVFIDDGKIAATVVGLDSEYVEVETLSPQDKPTRLRAEKGINLPDTRLSLPALTAEDREALRFAAARADAIGLSFVHNPNDLCDLSRQLADLGREDLGIIAKIETREALGNLALILLQGLTQASFGVMIARGDLAVEIGFENLALVQEDILCLCEAAHVPVIWATQVLETLAQSGLPARAEITDAAMGQRAECVMLNKGLHIEEAVETLAELLTSEERRRIKKRQVFREFITQKGVFETPYVRAPS